MAILCIKIGENAPSDYPQFDRLYKHGDLVDVLPRQRLADGTALPDDRSPGVMAEQEFLLVRVDWSNLTDRQFAARRAALTQSVWENTGGFDPDGRAIFRILHRRRYRFNFLPALVSPAAQTALVALADQRRLGGAIDARPHHLTAAPLPWTALFPAVFDHTLNQSLAQTPLRAAFVP